MSDILTPEQADGIRDRIRAAARVYDDETFSSLFSYMLLMHNSHEALREQLLMEQACYEGDMGALREQLREAERQEQVAYDRGLVDGIVPRIRHLTDALREAKPALLRGANQFDGEVTDWSHKKHDGGIFGDPCGCCDQLRADAAALRALTEMEGDDGESS